MTILKWEGIQEGGNPARPADWEPRDAPSVEQRSWRTRGPGAGIARASRTEASAAGRCRAAC